MKYPRHLILVMLLLFSLGAGPVWYEPAAQTGEAIEKAIADAYKDPRGRVFLPGGTYRLSRTITLLDKGPMLIEGASEAQVANEWNHPTSVKLEWHGPPGKPMFKINTFGFNLRNVLLDGRGIAAQGIQLVNDPHQGTAMNHLEDVTFVAFTTACFQAGDQTRDGNCADSFFDRVQFSGSPTGFKSVNEQSVNNHFNGCQFLFLQCALDIERGGGVLVSGGGGGAIDLFLHLRYGGHNTGAIQIGPLRLERAGYKNRYLSLVDARIDDANSGGVDCGQIRLESIRLAGNQNFNAPDADTPLFRIGPGAAVTAVGCLFKQTGDNQQWAFASVLGKKGVGYAMFRAEDTIWMGNFENIISNEMAKVELLNATSPGGPPTNFTRGLK